MANEKDMFEDYNPNSPDALYDSNPIENLGEKMGGLKIGIVGHGFVGGAVDYAFTHPDVEKFFVDPKHNTTLEQLIEWEPHMTFICLPTPMSESGFVDASLVEDTALRLFEDTKGAVIIKSTITPDIVDRIANSLFEEDMRRLVYNPEFLTESNAKEQFVMAPFHILGGHPECTHDIEQLYDMFSLCTAEKYIHMSAPEASFVKYGVNSFLATKVTFFNQLYDAVNNFGCNFPQIVNAIGLDPRIGQGHTRVPGYDGKRGFGGACFPKDLVAFNKFDEKHLTLIDEVCKINNSYRKEYDLDDRERVNNIKYGEDNVDNGQTKKELEDQND